MGKLLHMFYKGEIRPSEQREYMVEEYEKKRQILSLKEEAFCAELTEAQKRTYVEIMDEYTGLLPEEAEEIYIQGMRMGAKMAVELLGGEKRV